MSEKHHRMTTSLVTCFSFSSGKTYVPRLQRKKIKCVKPKMSVTQTAKRQMQADFAPVSLSCCGKDLISSRVPGFPHVPDRVWARARSLLSSHLPRSPTHACSSLLTSSAGDRQICFLLSVFCYCREVHRCRARWAGARASCCRGRACRQLLATGTLNIFSRDHGKCLGPDNMVSQLLHGYVCLMQIYLILRFSAPV